MAQTVTDTASSLLHWLKTHADAAAIRARVQGGATNILEAGDMTPAILEAAQSARRTAGNTTNLLVVTVQDAGAEPARLGEGAQEQAVVVRLIDRDRGYRNLQLVRDALLEQLDGDYQVPAITVGGRQAGLLHLAFAGRTGYRASKEFAASFEAITFLGLVVAEEDE
jgi:hypothetical protein